MWEFEIIKNANNNKLFINMKVTTIVDSNSKKILTRPMAKLFFNCTRE